jgi:hypothetical protein
MIIKTTCLQIDFADFSMPVGADARRFVFAFFDAGWKPALLGTSDFADSSEPALTPR